MRFTALLPILLLGGCDLLGPTKATPSAAPTATPKPPAGLDWVQLPMPGIAVQFLTPQEGWTLGVGATLYHTHDGGKTYETVPLGSDRRLETRVLCFADARHGFVGGSYRTTDGGATWVPMTSPGGGVTDMAFAGASEGALTDGSALYLTHDGGESWAKDEAFTDAPLRLGVIDGKLAALGADKLWHRNAGGEWLSAKLPAPASSRSSFSFPGATVGYAALGRQVYQTADLGESWTSVLGGQQEGHVAFAAEGTGWVVSSLYADLAIQLTTTGGAHWTNWPAGRVWPDSVVSGGTDQYSFESPQQLQVLDEHHAYYAWGGPLLSLNSP